MITRTNEVDVPDSSPQFKLIRADLSTELLNAIDIYLTDDNPKRNTLLAPAYRLWTGSGKAGRQRALNYREVVLNILDDNELSLKVIQDCESSDGYGELGSSVKLRHRLIIALANYFDLDLRRFEIIDRTTVATENSARLSAAHHTGDEMLSDTELLFNLKEARGLESRTHIRHVTSGLGLSAPESFNL